MADVGEEGRLRAIDLGERLRTTALVLKGPGRRDRRTDMPGNEFEEGEVALIDPTSRTGAGHQERGRSFLARYRDGHNHDFRDRLRPEIADEFMSVDGGNDDGPCDLRRGPQGLKSRHIAADRKAFRNRPCGLDR